MLMEKESVEKMLDKNYVLGWEDVECDLYEENGHVFGIELDLFNGHESYYCKTVKKSSPHSDTQHIEHYQYLSDDIYEAIEQFNAMLQKG